MADGHAGDVRDGIEWPGRAQPDRIPRSRARIAATVTNLRAPTWTFRRPLACDPAVSSPRDPHRSRPARSRRTAPSLRMRRLPERIAAARDHRRRRGVPRPAGLALLESARPGRNARWTYLTADPVAVLEAPAAGPDPFAVARRLVARLDATPVVPADAPRFLGGLVGFLGYDLGHVLERLPSVADDDQGLPPLRLALHDWVVAWDRRTGHAWLGGPRAGRRWPSPGTAPGRGPRTTDDAGRGSPPPASATARHGRRPAALPLVACPAPRTRPASSGSASTSPWATSTRPT